MGFFEQFKHRARQHLSRPAKRSEAQPLIRPSKVEHISLLIDLDQIGQAWALIRPFVRSWAWSGAELGVLAYAEDLTKHEPLPQEALCFGAKELNWLGRVKKPEIEAFLSRKQQLLIVPNPRDCDVLGQMAAESSAAFKVGLAHHIEAETRYDFSLYCSQGEATSWEAIFKGLSFGLSRINLA